MWVADSSRRIAKVWKKVERESRMECTWRSTSIEATISCTWFSSSDSSGSSLGRLCPMEGVVLVPGEDRRATGFGGRSAAVCKERSASTSATQRAQTVLASLSWSLRLSSLAQIWGRRSGAAMPRRMLLVEMV